MKVLQVNCVYGNGSTGKIVRDIHHELQSMGVDSVVCYGRGQKVSEPNVYKVCGELYSKLNNAFSRITGMMYGGCFFSTNRLIHIIKKERPDVVHLHCINGYFVNIYRLLTWLKNNNIKTVLTLHAEFMYTANCGHALECERWKIGCGKCPRLKKETKSLFFDHTALSFRKMKKAFVGFDRSLIVVSVSPWLMERAKQSPILTGKSHYVILNGVDTNVFHPRRTDDLRAVHGLNDEKVIFHATPFFSNDTEHLKGGYFVLKLAEMLREENVKIIVAGKYADTLLVPENVILLGEIRDQQKMAEYYSMADVTVLTSKKETFSMITAESLCCGTPVVGFKAGAPEQIALSDFSFFGEHGDIQSLHGMIYDMLLSQYDREIIASHADKKYSRVTMGQKYYEIYFNMNGAI